MTVAVRRARPGCSPASAICLLAAGCANIPSSSRPQIIPETLAGRPSRAADSDLRYDAIVPQPGEQPGGHRP